MKSTVWDCEMGKLVYLCRDAVASIVGQNPRYHDAFSVVGVDAVAMDTRK